MINHLRAEYERLASAVIKSAPGSDERKRLMEAKRVAFGKWYATKDEPQAGPPIAEVPVAVEEIAPGVVIVTADPIEDEPCSPSSSASTPSEPATRPRRARWNKPRDRSASRPTSGE